MAEADPKFNPTQGTADAEPTVDVDATEESSAGVAHQTKFTLQEAAPEKASAVKDNVFSMFGGGPKKEKKVDQDEQAEELFGGSKPQKKEEEVSTMQRTTFTQG
jgi:Ran-binding protein 1